jgi:hypothetical protein
MTMRSRVSTVLALFAATLMVLQMNGCCILGFTVGAISDAKKPDSEAIPGWEVSTIKPGTKIGISLRDGTEISGKFRSLEQTSTAEYTSRYEEIRGQQPDGLILPTIGDTITVISKSGDQFVGEFCGFDYEVMCIRLPRMTEPIKGNLDLVSSIIDRRGNVVEMGTIRKLTSEGEIPFLSEIVLQSEGWSYWSELGEVRIPLDKIYQIQVPVKKRGALTGLLVGAAVDVIVIAVVASGDDDTPTRRTTSTGGSIMCGCPFIYSFDGVSYIIDSETFGGSIFEAAQRTDWDRLDHLRAIEDTCRLKIVDQLQETDYVDELRLLVVDHPKGIEVIPSFDGTVHTISDPQMPTKAMDYRGNDVLHLIKAKDELAWVSNPFGRDPDIEAHARDGIDLEFPKPPGASSVKLVFNTLNTFWGAYLQSHFLELHGRDLDQWYEMWNRSEEARQKLQEVMVQEGMLLIKLWDGQSWQNANFIWEVGASVSRDQVVCLDIGDIPGEVLRIRLDSSPGIWMVNSIQADYTQDWHCKITDVPLDQAVDHLGEDILEQLQETDCHYYVMYTGDWAELTFSVPPEIKGHNRSFILQSSGYYKINVTAEGEPRTDLLARFMSEPGAFGQYTIRLINDLTTFALAR